MPNFKLADPDVRERMLGFIRGGAGRHEAAHMAGVSAGAYRNYVKAHPEFTREVEDAVNASIEPVTKMLREEALDPGNKSSDKVAAAKEYRQHIDRQAPPPAARVEHEHTLNLGEVAAGQLDAVTALRDTLAGRAELGTGEEDTVDTEAVEEDGDLVYEVQLQDEA